MLIALKNNSFLFNTIWFFRRMVGITPEKLNADFHKRNQKKLFDAYFQSNKVYKLQIGAQSNSIGDWLNVDLEPKSREVAFMDATQPFPFANETFDYIFSEHMIEHISFEDGDFMLQECFRVLKKGGKIRISTPNLAFLINLYQESKNQIQLDYLNFSKRYFENKVPLTDTVVINNFFKSWGHQFIHDEKSLRYLLEKAGFKNIQGKQVNQSDEPHFQNIEQHGKEVTDEFNVLESVLVEAEK